MTRMSAIAAVASSLLLVAGCQNWDLKRPEQKTPARAFTRIEDGQPQPQPLTNEVALGRLEAIEQADAEDRIQLVKDFFADFPRARLIPQVHQLEGEAYVAQGMPDQAADAFQRALALTRTDVLGLPLEPDLPLQLGMARISAGQYEEGLEWLVRTSIADRSDRVRQALSWAHAQQPNAALFADWLREQRDRFRVSAPGFTLPALAGGTMSLEPGAGKATLLNFWSPT